MKFSCGENWKHKKERLENWHDFFCLWPRTISVDETGKDICAWIETIERRGSFICWPGDCYWNWEYRAKK